MSNREMIENALKRVNALAGTKGKYYRGSEGWFVVDPITTRGRRLFDESNRPAGELLAYLHGIEDTLKFKEGKRELSFDELSAVESLITLVRDLGLFVDDEEEDWVHTTGETLNLESFAKEDWETCLNLIKEG